MALSPSDAGLAGMTVMAMGFLSRGLLDLLKKKSATEEQSRLLLEMRGLRKALDSHASDDERAQSENSRLLNMIITNLARIEGRLCP